MFSGNNVKFDRIIFNSNVSYSLMQENGTFGLGDLLIFFCWWFDPDVSFHQCWKYRIWILLILQWIFKRWANSLWHKIIKQPKHFKSCGSVFIWWWKHFVKFWGCRWDQNIVKIICEHKNLWWLYKFVISKLYWHRIFNSNN